jgi:4-amino-4-deoxy-L-arabinose transferase-like glycosyltransferase
MTSNAEIMKQKTAGALVWVSGIFLLTGLLILSPAGGFSLFCLAAICAVFPAIFSQRVLRIIAVILLLASLALAAVYYPAFIRDRDEYMRRAKKHTLESTVSPAPDLKDKR